MPALPRSFKPEVEADGLARARMLEKFRGGFAVGGEDDVIEGQGRGGGVVPDLEDFAPRAGRCGQEAQGCVQAHEDFGAAGFGAGVRGELRRVERERVRRRAAR